MLQFSCHLLDALLVGASQAVHRCLCTFYINISANFLFLPRRPKKRSLVCPICINQSLTHRGSNLSEFTLYIAGRSNFLQRNSNTVFHSLNLESVRWKNLVGKMSGMEGTATGHLEGTDSILILIWIELDVMPVSWLFHSEIKNIFF